MKKSKLLGKVKDIRFQTFKANQVLGEIGQGNISKNPDDNYLLKFNEKGYRISNTTFNISGTINYQDTFLYDTNNVLIEMRRSLPHGIITSKRKYEFDEKNNLIKEVWYYDNLPETRYANKYDTLGNLIEQCIYDEVNKIMTDKFYYKYDDYDNEIERHIYDGKGKLIFIYKATYDDDDMKIEESTYRPDGSLYVKYTYEYVFDEKKNWIKLTYLKNNIPDEISVRTINYYD
ncbi:MAG: hypothetical protein WC223_05600 [Bacteroidales bacterium]